MYGNNSFRRMPKLLKGLLFLALAALFLFVLGNVIMYLWNMILVEVTGVKPLNFWKALGLFALSRLLFGGFRSGGRRGKWGKARGRRWREKWMKMSDEERAAFKAKWKERCKR